MTEGRKLDSLVLLVWERGDLFEARKELAYMPND